MEDYKIWLYLIIGAVYFISRLMKQKKGQPEIEQEDEPVSSSPTTGKRQMTFEELLKEITDSKKGATTTSPQPASTFTTSRPRQDYVDYDDDIKEEIEDLEDVDYKSDSKVFEIYEQAKKQAFNRPSLEETSRIEDTKPTYDRFKEFTIKKKGTLLRKYASELRTRGGFKRAIVLNEILNRRF